jgi:hypothetical protein
MRCVPSFAPPPVSSLCTNAWYPRETLVYGSPLSNSPFTISTAEVTYSILFNFNVQVGFRRVRLAWVSSRCHVQAIHVKRPYEQVTRRLERGLTAGVVLSEWPPSGGVRSGGVRVRLDLYKTDPCRLSVVGRGWKGSASDFAME